MGAEPNLFGDLQDRNPAPPKVRAYFSIDDESGLYCSGFCLLESDELKEENPVEVKVIEWEDEPDWSDHPELDGVDKTVFWLYPAYDCKLEP